MSREAVFRDGALATLMKSLRAINGKLDMLLAVAEVEADQRDIDGEIARAYRRGYRAGHEAGKRGAALRSDPAPRALRRPAAVEVAA